VYRDAAIAVLLASEHERGSPAGLFRWTAWFRF